MHGALLGLLRCLGERSLSPLMAWRKAISSLTHTTDP